MYLSRKENAADDLCKGNRIIGGKRQLRTGKIRFF